MVDDFQVLATGMPLVPGAFLGVLIGFVTGLVFALFLGLAYRATSVAALLKVTPSLLAVPTFWFGGPWVTTSLLSDINTDEILDSYVVFLAITFTAFVSWPAFRLIIGISRRIQEEGNA
jgi:hypothetical protein